MAQITIEIPEGLPDDQKADLAGWLTTIAQEAVATSPAIDDDEAVRADATRRIRQGADEIAAGRGVDGREALARLAAKHGLRLPK